MSMLKFFRFPFAVAGDKTTVPDDSQPTGSVSYEDGFGPDYELDPAVDPAAKDVPRDETNQLFYDITNAIKEYQEFGVPDYITAALNGGVAFSYSKYARVKWTDGKVYESKVNANTADPSDATKWRALTDNADYLTIATGVTFEASVIDGEAVYWDSVNNRFDEAVADGTTKQNVIGFADVTNSRVFVAGLYAGQLAGLAANTQYYLSTVTPGAITSALPASNIISLGIAKNATDLYVKITPPANVPAASETVAGIAEIATQAETDTGSSSQVIVTPGKLRNGYAQDLSATGYIKLPSWMGGFMLQWGTVNFTTAGTASSFPIAFPNSCFGVVATVRRAGSPNAFISTSTPTTTGFSGYCSGSGVTESVHYLAFGR